MRTRAIASKRADWKTVSEVVEAVENDRFESLQPRGLGNAERRLFENPGFRRDLHLPDPLEIEPVKMNELFQRACASTSGMLELFLLVHGREKFSPAFTPASMRSRKVDRTLRAGNPSGTARLSRSTNGRSDRRMSFTSVEESGSEMTGGGLPIVEEAAGFPYQRIGELRHGQEMNPPAVGGRRRETRS